MKHPFDIGPDLPECPHCWHKVVDPLDLEWSIADTCVTECDNCSREYMIRRTGSFTYSSDPLEPINNTTK